jgi:hypothetical protein
MFSGEDVDEIGVFVVSTQIGRPRTYVRLSLVFSHLSASEDKLRHAL